MYADTDEMRLIRAKGSTFHRRLRSMYVDRRSGFLESLRETCATTTR